MGRHMSVLAAVAICALVLFSSCAPQVRTECVERRLVFPDDLSPHRGYPVEWWYQTGYLYEEGEEGLPRFAYEFTVFRAFAPNRPEWPKVLFIPVGETWIAHFVLHDLKSDSREFAEVLFPPFLLTLWPTVGTGGDHFFIEASSEKMSFRFAGDIKKLTLKVAAGQMGINLELSSKKPPVAHNGGVVPMVEGESYYYSLTRLLARGTVVWKGKTYRVWGWSWFDQQWGPFAAKPWDWISIRLESGEEIMAFVFPQYGVRFGTFVDQSGRAVSLKDFSLRLEGQVESPEGKIIPIPDPGYLEAPEIEAKLRIKALSRNQLNAAKHTPIYWEGICRVEGQIGEKAVRGFAFFEGWR